MSTNNATSINIFSYGTLRDPNVQKQVLNRQVTAWPDSLSKYELSYITITDKSVLAISNQNKHPIINYSGCANDIIEGVLLEITPPELANFDKYETDDYHRIEVLLNSGKTAFAYVAINPSEHLHYTFEIIEKSWSKRRRLEKIPKPRTVNIPDFTLRENAYCNMIVEYEDGSVKTLFSRVIRNHITKQWTVDGMLEAVKVICSDI